MSISISPGGENDPEVLSTAFECEGTSLVSEILGDLGLSPSENAVFTTLLRLGSRQASVISRHTGIHRTRIYDVVDRLQSRKFVHQHEREGVKYFSAVSLDELMFQISQRETTLAEHRRRLSEVVREAKTSRIDLFSDPRSRLTKGAEALKRALLELSGTGVGDLLFFCSAKDSLVLEEGASITEAIQQLLREAPAQLRIVLHSCDESTKNVVRDIEGLRITSISQALPADMIVSGTQITILGKKADRPLALSIEQPALAQSILAFGFSLIN